MSLRRQLDDTFLAIAHSHHQTMMSHWWWDKHRIVTVSCDSTGAVAMIHSGGASWKKSDFAQSNQAGNFKGWQKMSINDHLSNCWDFQPL